VFFLFYRKYAPACLYRGRLITIITVSRSSAAHDHTANNDREIRFFDYRRIDLVPTRPPWKRSLPNETAPMLRPPDTRHFQLQMHLPRPTTDAL